jgi:arabinogalactan oligomer/maltooligosaccharide transport system permease protein
MATNNQVGRLSTTPNQQPSFWYRSRETRGAYLYLLPAGIIMSIITLFPMGFEVYMSFTDYGIKNLRSTSPAPNWVGLDNYINIVNSDTLSSTLQNFDFFRILIFDLWWALSNGVLHLVFGVLIAVLLNVDGLWFKRFYRAIYILPVVIPAIIIGTVWRNIFDQHGPINDLLRFFLGFLGNFDIDWLSNSSLNPTTANFVDNIFTQAYWAMLVANVWLGWPLYSVVATGALQSIPKELYEAAIVDGANGPQQFFSITIPLLRPAMLPYAVFGFITTFNLFHLSFFMSGGNPFNRTELLVTEVYKLVQTNQLYGLASAFSVYMFFILLAISLVTNRIAKATASYDA